MYQRKIAWEFPTLLCNFPSTSRNDARGHRGVKLFWFISLQGEKKRVGAILEDRQESKQKSGLDSWQWERIKVKEWE